MVRPGQLVGHVLGGRYRLIGTLGEGGVGTVYEAREEELGRKVAVKVLHLALASDPAWTRRMEREARAMAALDHPNIVQITDFQLTPGGLPFLVMERLTGMSFAELIEKEAPLASPRVVNIALQTLDALGVAHRAGIVHRDIKPENLFLVTTPATPDFVKVLDFGIAKAIEGAATSGALSMTHTGAVLGTAGYMPPEQARGEALDARADIFAVGACMYEALAGRMASTDARTEAAASVRSIRTPKVEDVSALARRRPDLDPALTAIVTRALATDPDARYANAQEMIDALRGIATRRTPSPSELAPTDPMAQPIVPTPRAQAVTPPPQTRPHVHRQPPPPPPAHPRPPSSVIGWVVAALVTCFVLVPGCILLRTVIHARTRPREIVPLPDPRPTASAPVPMPDDSNDDADDAPVPLATPTSRRFPRSLPIGPDASSPSILPTQNPPPSPKPTSSSKREPWENPPDLLDSHATFLRALQIDDPHIVGRLRSFVIATVSPITHECFRKFGFAHEKGQHLKSEVQMTIHGDGRIDSIEEQWLTGMRQVTCVREKLTAMTAPGTCLNTKPTSCTFYVRLEGRYR